MGNLMAREVSAMMEAGHSADRLCLCEPLRAVREWQVPAEPMERASWRAWEPRDCRLITCGTAELAAAASSPMPVSTWEATLFLCQ